MTNRYQDFAKMIDHSLLQPTMTVDQLEAGISLALEYDVASVCIMPYYLKRCAERLAGSTVKASTTIGFPHGVQTTQVKQREAEQAISDGCEELDFVVNISKVLSGDWEFVSAEIEAVTKIAHDAGQAVKIIFENCYLDDAQKIRLCEICNDLNVDWVKTSTGFGTGGATLEDLKLMRTHANANVQVKAAGGIRDFEGLKAVRDLGVTRCGASRTKDILDACRTELGLSPIA
ncbi:deoxyribose-phosphate aldolase [Roseimaritima multifibrata]|nr:deoxyribose-phosphate aldolase [Roseimaritima multifibrata]